MFERKRGLLTLLNLFGSVAGSNILCYYTACCVAELFQSVAGQGQIGTEQRPGGEKYQYMADLHRLES